MAQKIDFASFKRSGRPNNVLMLPPGFQAASKADAESPMFEGTAEALADAAKSIALGWPRTALLNDVDGNHQFAVVQRSKICRWPDTMTVQALPVADGGASLAIYSAAKYGYRDFGVNRTRVEDLLKALEAIMQTR